MKALPHLICSIPNDGSTNQVMDWMDFLGEHCIRINRAFGDVNNTIGLSNEGTEPQNYASIWYRKIMGPKGFSFLQSNDVEDWFKDGNVLALNFFIRAEHRVLYDFFYKKYTASRILAPYESLTVNKLEVLQHAVQVGMNIPETFITAEKSKLKEFKDRFEKGIIHKSLNEMARVQVDHPEPQYFLLYTTEITAALLDSLPDVFSPSLFQEKLDKAYEIRTFYLDGKCYSMAIFSQKNARTAVDFRKYDYENPNRKSVYQLDEDTEQQIKWLMDGLNLNTGSLDFVRTKDGRLVFLEVNPAGQYGMTSGPCNYYLDREIANFLAQKSNDNEEKIPGIFEARS